MGVRRPFSRGGQNFSWGPKTTKKRLFFSKESKNILFLADQGGKSPLAPLQTPMLEPHSPRKRLIDWKLDYFWWIFALGFRERKFNPYKIVLTSKLLEFFGALQEETQNRESKRQKFWRRNLSAGAHNQRLFKSQFSTINYKFFTFLQFISRFFPKPIWQVKVKLA